jgi:diguanylate cyclase (GGDEF)-like protein
MFNLPQDLPEDELGSEVSDRLARAGRAILYVPALLVLVSVVGWLLRVVDPDILPGWNPMNMQAMLLTTFIGGCLVLSHPRYSRARHIASILLACFVALLSLAVIVEYAFHTSFGIDSANVLGQPVRNDLSSRIALQSALGFAALGVACIFATVRKSALMLAADMLTFFQAAVVLTVVTGHFIAVSQVFDSKTPVQTSAQTMICMFLLSTVLLMRRTESGILNIFIGEGSGSKVARVLVPLIIVLPFFREAMRARFISENHMPAYYTTALLGVIAVLVSTAILIYLARRINSMEAEVHDLSLRDGLTDLHNLRGFQLLAEQALRLAHRLNAPFSVLFIDLDDLKKTNDTLGHQAGSDLLIEVAEILKSSFRETDVLGRIGGDEFAVAGQFSEEHIARAAHQLEVSADVANRARTHPPMLSFSVGCVTMQPGGGEALDSLLARADRAMYSVKRQKKEAARAKSAPQGSRA